MFLLNIFKNQRYRKLYALLNNGNVPSRLPPERESAKFITMQLQTLLRQAQESTAVVYNTKNPDTFYERLAFLMERTNTLAQAEQLAPHLFKGDSPRKALKQLEAQRQQLELDMWKRYFDDALENAAKLKTDKGRANALNRAAENAAKYQSSASDQARAYIAQRIAAIRGGAHA